MWRKSFLGTYFTGKTYIVNQVIQNRETCISDVPVIRVITVVELHLCSINFRIVSYTTTGTGCPCASQPTWSVFFFFFSFSELITTRNTLLLPHHWFSGSRSSFFGCFFAPLTSHNGCNMITQWSLSLTMAPYAMEIAHDIVLSLLRDQWQVATS